MSQLTTIADLRRLLADRFPVAPTRDGRCVGTDIASFDEVLGGGLGSGTFTEVVSAAPSCGGQLLTDALIRSTRLARQRMALLDAADAFDPQSDDGMTAHLVWFRGSNFKTFWQAADIIFRDANFAVTVMDLRGLPERELRRVLGTTWYRLQRAIEQSETAVVVHTDYALVPCASRRLMLAEPMTMAAFKMERTDLQEALRPEQHLQRTNRRIAG